MRGYNARSIGVELVNTGRYPDWLNSQRQEMNEAYPGTQIEAFCALATALVEHLPNMKWIAGHEDLDTGKVAASDNPDLLVHRKRDPGPMFPWQTVLDQTGLERWLPAST